MRHVNKKYEKPKSVPNNLKAFNRRCLARYDEKFGEIYINAMGNHIIRGLRGVRYAEGRNVILLFNWDDNKVMSFKFNHKHPLVEN